MRECNNFSYYNGDILVILKNDKQSDLRDCYYRIKDNTLIIGRSYNDKLAFDGKDYKFLSKWLDRLEYAYASSRNDKELDDIVKSNLGIDAVDVPCERYTKKYYLKHWMEKYNFTLEDFIFNDKYIILSGDCRNRIIDKLIDLGMLNEDNIEACSIEEEEE